MHSTAVSINNNRLRRMSSISAVPQVQVHIWTNVKGRLFDIGARSPFESLNGPRPAALFSLPGSARRSGGAEVGRAIKHQGRKSSNENAT